jgi:RHS repeat-associated protein
VNDPSRGLETAHYNGLDDVIRTTDALNRERELFYDDFGRLERIDDVDGSTHYAYDGTGPNEIGRLVEATSPTGYTTRYSYEPPTVTRNRGLLTGVTESAFPLETPNAVGRSLTTGYYFDDAARLSQIDYPKSESGGVSLRYHYDDYGHVVKVTHSQNASNVFWELLEAEEGYRIGTERVGNAQCGSTLGTTTVRSYKPGTDALSGITTTCGASTLQNLTYGYDEAGNLTSRNDAVANQNRTFDYDALNRLTHVDGIETYTYDPERGRLTSRSGVGSYAYRAEPSPESPRDWLDKLGGPSGTTYVHDAVGNVTERSGASVPGGRQVFTYSGFDLPKLIESGPSGSENATRFAYGASGSRLAKQTEGPTPRITFYAGDAYQRTESSISATPQAAQHRSVIYAGGRAVAQLTSGENADGTLSAPAVRYLYDDVVGSVQTITDAAGALVGTRDYEAFGKHGGELSNDVMLGFTGHEEDTDLGLVNMKGRIYDPVAGQFLQTDPIMAEPYSQGLNRYAYVNNSPLNYIDPTGLTLDERDQLGIGVSAFGAGVIGGTGCAAYCGSIAGWLGSGGGAALGSAGSAALSAWNIVNPRVSQSGTSTAPQQSRSAPASGRGVPSRGRAAVSDVAPVREGPPKNKGGVGPSFGAGRYELGAEGSGPGGRADPTEVPGRFLQAAGDGLYRLSNEGRRLLRPTFDQLGYDVSKARIRFEAVSASGNPQAYTDGNLVTLDIGQWNGLRPARQLRLLGHELGHSVQFEKLGYVNTRLRTGFERLMNSQADLYDVPGALHRIPLKNLNVGDSRFTLEAIAEHIANHIRPPP